MKQLLPDLPRLGAALDEVLAAIDCDIDPELSPKVRARLFRFQKAALKLVSDGSNLQIQFEQLIPQKHRSEIQKDVKSYKRS